MLCTPAPSDSSRNVGDPGDPAAAEGGQHAEVQAAVAGAQRAHDRTGPGDRASPPSRSRRYRRDRDEREWTCHPLTARA